MTSFLLAGDRVAYEKHPKAKASGIKTTTSGIGVGRFLDPKVNFNPEIGISFLCSHSEQLGLETKNVISFKSSPQNLMFITLAKSMQDLYEENLKTLMIQSKKIQINGEVSHVHG